MTDSITIKALTPELAEDYFDFFDNRAFADGSPFSPCYCNAFNMSLQQIKTELFAVAEAYGGADRWKRALRASADRMVRSGTIRGYLAYDGETAVGWCNANDRLSYYRVGEFDMDDIPEDAAPADCPGTGIVKSVVCFAIAPAYRGKGIARKLLERVCEDAAKEGYAPALRVFNTFVRYLAMTLNNITAFFDPDMIVLGGGVSHAGDFLLDAVRILLPRHQMFKTLPAPKVELARLGNEAGIIGAALLGKNLYA